MRASRGVNLPTWQQQQCVVALGSFILGLLPGLKPMVWLIRPICLRVLAGPDSQPIAVSLHTSSSEIPATSCSLRGRRGKDVWQDLPVPVVSKKA